MYLEIFFLITVLLYLFSKMKKELIIILIFINKLFFFI